MEKYLELVNTLAWAKAESIEFRLRYLCDKWGVEPIGGRDLSITETIIVLAEHAYLYHKDQEGSE